jgi:hypothetical protein
MFDNSFSGSCTCSLQSFIEDALLAFAQYHLPDSFLMLRRLEDGPKYPIPEGVLYETVRSCGRASAFGVKSKNFAARLLRETFFAYVSI